MVKNPAKLPSTTPIPKGKKETNPKMIDVAYIEVTLKNSRVKSNDKTTKYTIILSTIQNKKDKAVA